MRHEQAAVHAADGYSRSSNKVGVALVTSGPGATNAVTGIATAYSDSIPMVVISGQVGTPAIGLDAFQEVDMVGITRPCVKHNFLVKDVNDLAATMKRRLHRPHWPAWPGGGGHPQGRHHRQDRLPVPGFGQYPLVCADQQGPSGSDQKAVNLLGEAKRPFVYVGGGAVLANASEEVRELVRLINARAPTR